MVRCGIGTRTPNQPPYRIAPQKVWFWELAFLPDSQSFLPVTHGEGAVVRWGAATLNEIGKLTFLGTDHTSPSPIQPPSRLGETAWLSVFMGTSTCPCRRITSWCG